MAILISLFYYQRQRKKTKLEICTPVVRPQTSTFVTHVITGLMKPWTRMRACRFQCQSVTWYCHVTDWRTSGDFLRVLPVDHVRVYNRKCAVIVSAALVLKPISSAYLFVFSFKCDTK